MKAIQILPGQRFSRLVATGRTEKRYNGRKYCECQCDCGSPARWVPLQSLTSGATVSCGCYPQCKTHGESKTRLHKIWRGMRSRCSNPNNPKYKRYGARGISVATEWEVYEAFASWAKENGYSSSLSIDRVNNDGNYTPSNCRWATTSVQSRNKRTTTCFTAFGESKCMRDWELDERVHITRKGILHRMLSRDMSFSEAISTPKHQRRSRSMV